MRSRARASLACACALAYTSGHASARANGRFPTATQLVAAPSDPRTLVVRATFGLLVSHDAGASWGWVCESAIGYSGTQDPMLGMMRGGIVAGTLQGLARSADEGCSWGFALSQTVIDVVVRKADPTRALALVSDYAPTDGGVASFAAKVVATADDGAHWAPYGAALDPAILGETIEVAASDSRRVYISGVRQDADGGAAGVFLASNDDGASWTEHAVAMNEGESAPYVSAVDPKNEDRVYVRIKGKNGTRLVVTDDGGAHFRDALQAHGDLLGFALSDDGTRVFVGGPDDGLLVASTADLQFTQTAMQPIQCLTVVGNTLYACMGSPHAFALQVLGVSIDDGATLTPGFQFTCVPGPLACPAGSKTAACTSEWGALQASFGPSQCVSPIDAGQATDAAKPADASAPTGDVDSGGVDAAIDAAPSASAPAAGCGCGVGEESGGSAAALIAAALIAAALGCGARLRRARAGRRRAR